MKLNGFQQKCAAKLNHCWKFIDFKSEKFEPRLCLRVLFACVCVFLNMVFKEMNENWFGLKINEASFHRRKRILGEIEITEMKMRAAVIIGGILSQMCNSIIGDRFWVHKIIRYTVAHPNANGMKLWNDNKHKMTESLSQKEREREGGREGGRERETERQKEKKRLYLTSTVCIFFG